MEQQGEHRRLQLFGFHLTTEVFGRPPDHQSAEEDGDDDVEGMWREPFPPTPLKAAFRSMSDRATRPLIGLKLSSMPFTARSRRLSP